jgi:hypothetical protein
MREIGEGRNTRRGKRGTTRSVGRMEESHTRKEGRKDRRKDGRKGRYRKEERKDRRTEQRTEGGKEGRKAKDRWLRMAKEGRLRKKV